MPCGSCGPDASYVASSEGVMTGYTPAAGTNGVYRLAQAPDCDRPYNGKQRRASVFVVGMPSTAEEERIFKWVDRKDAIAYAKENSLRLHGLPAQNLCEEIMLAFFGE